jgi:hypothetical protein
MDAVVKRWSSLEQTSALAAEEEKGTLILTVHNLFHN